MSVVLDASAVLALLRNEPGADAVSDALDAWVHDEAAVPLVCAVNWTEIAERIADPLILEAISGAVDIVPLDRPLAERAAALHAPTRPHGLSLGDRACLALAIERGLPALTADAAWAASGTDADVRLIR